MSNADLMVGFLSLAGIARCPFGKCMEPCGRSVTSLSFFLCFVGGVAEVGEDVIYDPAYSSGFFGCTALVCAPIKTLDFTVSFANL